MPHSSELLFSCLKWNPYCNGIPWRQADRQTDRRTPCMYVCALCIWLPAKARGRVEAWELQLQMLETESGTSVRAVRVLNSRANTPASKLCTHDNDDVIGIKFISCLISTKPQASPATERKHRKKWFLGYQACWTFLCQCVQFSKQTPSKWSWCLGFTV